MMMGGEDDTKKDTGAGAGDTTPVVDPDGNNA